MKHAFTLLELLVVVAIMGLLGTISVGGYRQMQQGMEERSAIDVASQFIRMAYQRAQIDRRPTAVYFWNEVLREADTEGYENEVVVGKAVAVRQYGRISGIDGNLLLDEFSDLERTFSTNAVSSSSDSGKGDTMRLYNLDNAKNGMKFSTVNASVSRTDITELYAFHNPSGDVGSGNDKGKLFPWGFNLRSDGGGDASWKTGSAYGFEFGTLTLPKGYIFTSTYSSKLSDPVKQLDNQTMVFLPATVGSTGSGGSKTIQIYALRPGEGGGLAATLVGTTKSPSQSQN